MELHFFAAKELFGSRTARIAENRTVSQVISGWVEDRKIFAGLAGTCQRKGDFGF